MVHQRLTGCVSLTGSSSSCADNLPEYDFEITEEAEVHRRYLTLYNRRIRFPPHHDKPVTEQSSQHAQLLHALSSMYGI
jgi:hypothetical protein